MKLLILISVLAAVSSRPQDSTSLQQEEAVQIEKQEIREVKPEQAKTLLVNDEDAKQTQNTREILEKILEVNRKHGLVPKGLQVSRDYAQQRSGTAKQQNFQFPQSPFSNPIFDYLNSDAASDKSRQNFPQNFDKPSFSITSTNARVDPEDYIPGQFIKRKVTHHQTYIMPVMGGYNPMGFGQMPNGFGYPNQPVQQNPQELLPQNPLQSFVQLPQQMIQPPKEDPSNLTNSSQPNTLKKTLENQTVENIKNIVNKQLPPLPFFNPYVYAPNQIQAMPPYYAFPSNVPQIPESLPLSSHSYRINGPSAKIPDEVLLQQLPRPGRQWQWPLAQFFPIVIRDPLQQIYNAFTSMIEYGQQSEALCADEQKKSTEATNNKVSRAGKNLFMDDLNEASQIHQNTNQPITMNIENLQMTNNKENPMKLTIDFKSPENAERGEKEFTNEDSLRVNTKLSKLAEGIEKNDKQKEEDMKGLLNLRDKKKEEKISYDENIKLFSKDNTGSGVFIHRLKVTKGGVAIAGPGGIATAGSGGTAIVGPNGYAYTQPDSLAIAGSGTKVIAVDPGINLSEVIDGAKRNKTKIINTRIGKIVAVGPTVYYNKG